MRGAREEWVERAWAHLPQLLLGVTALSADNTRRQYTQVYHVHLMQQH